jgi:Core-2/I-Branching enzyme
MVVTPLAVVILAHADAPHLRRLIGALSGIPVVLHCDRKTPESVYAEMTAGLARNVRVVGRTRTSLASWSLVNAEMRCLETALEWTRASHIAVLSGADYPLMSIDRIHRELAAWRGRTWMENVPVPTAKWNTRRQHDGGMWRFRRRYLVVRNQAVYVRGHPVPLPFRRAVPAELSLRAASQWKIYARHHVSALLEIAATRPDLMAFWRTTLVPEESFAASVLASPALLGADRLEPCESGAWFLEWRAQGDGHPQWLDDADLKKLRSGKLFARKFSSRQSRLLDEIDGDLRGARAGQ